MFNKNWNLRQTAPWLLVLCSAMLAVLAYLQALHYQFVSDDISYVATNQYLAGLKSSELWRLLDGPYTIGLEFLPLRDLSYWIDITLFGQDPAPYRIHNILIYLLCLPLLYAATSALWRYFLPADAQSAAWGAAAVTALFAVHPALVESVVWIAGRKYILPDFFSLLAIWLALKVRREDGFSTRYAGATLIAFIGVMLSKSSYIGVAPIIALLWFRFWLDAAPQQRKRLLLLWPCAILVLAVILLIVFVVHNNGFDTIPPYYGIEAVSRSLAILGGLTRISVSLGARHYFYPVFEDDWFPFMVASGLAMCAAAVWGVSAFLRRRSFAGFALFSFFLLCLPYLQLIPAKPPTIVADRYIALAIWCSILLTTLLAWRLRLGLRITVLFVIAFLWLYQTVERAQEWRSFESLTAVDLREYPGYYMPAFYTIVNAQLHNGLYREAGDTARQVSSPEIREAFLKLIRADYVLRVDAQTSGEPHEAISLLMDLGRFLEQPPAETRWNAPALFVWMKLKYALAAEWDFLAESFPGNARVRYASGTYWFNLHDYKAAEKHLRMASESESLSASLRGTAYLSLGVIYLEAGRYADAEAVLHTHQVQQLPGGKSHCLLERIYDRIGRHEDAEREAIACWGAVGG